MWFIFFSLFFDIAYSQNYISVDSIVDGYQKDLLNADQLTKLVTKDFSKEHERVRAIFKWVATTISYDVDLAKTMQSKATNTFSYKTEKEKEIKEKKFKSGLVTNSMNSRKAICRSYAALIEYLCLKSGFEAKIIIGN